MQVVVPANTTATVYVPARNADAVTESDKPLSEADGLKLLRTEKGDEPFVVLEAASGKYNFFVKGE
jgi:alpha-L-rhamnosidase